MSGDTFSLGQTHHWKWYALQLLIHVTYLYATISYSTNAPFQLYEKGIPLSKERSLGERRGGIAHSW